MPQSNPTSLNRERVTSIIQRRLTTNTDNWKKGRDVHPDIKLLPQQANNVIISLDIIYQNQTATKTMDKLSQVTNMSYTKVTISYYICEFKCYINTIDMVNYYAPIEKLLKYFLDINIWRVFMKHEVQVSFHNF